MTDVQQKKLNDLAAQGAKNIRRQNGSRSRSGTRDNERMNDDKGDWLAGAEVIVAPSQRPGASPRVVGLATAPIPLSQLHTRQLNWWGDSYMDRSPQMQRRPPIAMQRPNPSPRPQSAMSQVRATPSQLQSPRERKNPNPLVGGRPLHIARPPRRCGLSQQDVFTMMNDASMDPNASARAKSAREAAAQRACARQAAARREAQRAEVSGHAEASRLHAAEDERLRKLFGLGMQIE